MAPSTTTARPSGRTTRTSLVPLPAPAGTLKARRSATRLDTHALTVQVLEEAAAVDDEAAVRARGNHARDAHLGHGRRAGAACQERPDERRHAEAAHPATHQLPPSE